MRRLPVRHPPRRGCDLPIRGARRCRPASQRQDRIRRRAAPARRDEVQQDLPREAGCAGVGGGAARRPRPGPVDRPDDRASPLRTYADEWVRTRRLAPRTQEVYASPLKHIVATFGDTPLNAITRRAVRLWHADLSAPRQPVAGRQVLPAADGVPEHRRRGPPHRQEPMPRARCRAGGQRRATAHPGQRRPRARGRAIDPPYGGLLLLAATCELLGLIRGDLDFFHRRVIVKKQRLELASGIQVRRTKSPAGVRQITMPEYCGRPWHRRRAG